MSMRTPFGRRVAGVFATRVARFVAGLATSFLLARVLLPAGRGEYALLVQIPGMLMALGQFGPSALSFFAGRGRSIAQLQRLGLELAVVVSIVLVGGTLLLLPWLTSTILQPAPRDLMLLSLAALPFQLAATYAGATLIGRQRLRNYNVILIGQALLMLGLVVVLVGIFHLGVAGAVIAYLAVAVLAAIATSIELNRAVRQAAAVEPGISLAQLLGYGIRIYPASVTGYFSYRADIFILSAILGDASAIGLYSFAVSLAELTFFVPDAVTTVFYPRVASLDREAADALAPQVSRFTVLITALSVLFLIPAAFAAVRLILPDYTGSILPFLVIMPGIIALSISKVLSGYLGGLGLPLSVASASTANLVINIVANVLLIPSLGIVGAALASLISYSTHAGILAIIAGRLSRRHPLDFVIPTGTEGRRLLNGLREMLDRLRGGVRESP